MNDRITITSKGLHFEVVKDEMRKHPDVEINLPKRQTLGSMAYDFYSPVSAIIPPGQATMIWTDVKAVMPDAQVGLVLNVRSSMGMKGMTLKNSQGWVDADFANNPSNDGNIGICLQNNGTSDYMIMIDDRIAQGMFVPFLVTDDDEVLSAGRVGGFGSTGT